MNDRHRAVIDGYADEFARNRRLHGDRIRCGPGCSACCHQLFQITEIEAAEVWRGVETLPEEVARRLREQARAYLEERARLMNTGADGGEAWGSLPPAGARLACPALVDDRCAIYEHRPILCRKFGIPLWNPDRPGRVYACELNFAPGEEIEDGQLIQIQTELHGEWKQVQREYNESGGYRDPEPITVARAMLGRVPPGMIR
ncbi:MAG: YkgJ family cysteine cluster protein [Bryobacteraceae bacterium]